MRDDRDDQRASARSDTDEAAASLAYDWDLATDTITWGPNVGAVLGRDAALRLPTGTDYADHLAAASPILSLPSDHGVRRLRHWPVAFPTPRSTVSFH